MLLFDIDVHEFDDTAFEIDDSLLGVFLVCLLAGGPLSFLEDGGEMCVESLHLLVIHVFVRGFFVAGCNEIGIRRPGLQGLCKLHVECSKLLVSCFCSLHIVWLFIALRRR